MSRPIYALLASLVVLMSSEGGHAQANKSAAPADSPASAASGNSTTISEQAKRQFDKAADYSAQHSGRALLIQHNGQVLYERYDNRWNATTPHPLASGTKSFTGVMAVLAVQDGLLKLDELAADTLTEWKSDPRKSKITVRHLLTLSSGLTPGDRELSAGRSGSVLLGDLAGKRAERLGVDDNAPRPDNLNLRALELPCDTEPGARFKYGPSHFYAFSELLQRKLKKSERPEKSTLDYLRLRVLEPIGINVARIGRDKAGNPNLPGGMLLTAREWSKFGQFVLDGGTITTPDGDRQNLLKKDLLEQCFEPSSTNPQYGLTWWLKASDPEADVGGAFFKARSKAAQNPPVNGPDGKPLQVWMAAGLGKQRMYVIPQYKLVVVRFAEATSQGLRFDDRELLKPVVEGLAP